MDNNILTIVSVAFPIAVPGLYDYMIPAGLLGRVMPGMPVLVDLKNRGIWGVAVRLKTKSTFPSLKEVRDVASGRDWNRYYICRRVWGGGGDSVAD